MIIKTFTLLYLVFMLICFFVLPFVEKDTGNWLFSSITSYLNLLPENTDSLTLMGLILTVMYSFMNTRTQQKQLEKQEKSLEITIQANAIHYKIAHIEQFKSNLNHLYSSSGSSAIVDKENPITYGRIYSYTDIGKFNSDFEKKVERIFDELAPLLVKSVVFDDCRDEVAGRCYEIKRKVDELSALFRINCVLPLNIDTREERFYIMQFYSYLSVSFRNILTLTDGYIGHKYTDFALLASRIDVFEYEGTHLLSNDEFDEDKFKELVGYLPEKVLNELKN